jgi:hypothetical protein
MARKISQTLILRDTKWKVEILDELINKGYFLSRGEAYRFGVSIVLLLYGHLEHNEVKALCQQMLGDLLRKTIEVLNDKNINEFITKLNYIHNRFKILYKIADLNPIIHEIEILKIDDEILKIIENLKASPEEELNTILFNIREKLLKITEKYNI